MGRGKIFLVIALLGVGLVATVLFSKNSPVTSEQTDIVRSEPVAALPPPASIAAKAETVPSAPATEAPPVKANSNEEIVPPSPKSSVQSLENKVKANPNDEASLVELAEIYAKRPQYRDKAEQTFRKALDVNSENREALEGFLEMQRDPSKPGGPLQALEKLTEENPNSANIVAAYARTLANKGRTEEALAALERAVENVRADSMVFYSLMKLYEESGQYARASLTFEKSTSRLEEALANDKQGAAAELRTNLQRSRVMLATALIKSGSLERAEAVIKSIELAEPQNVSLPELRQELAAKRMGA